MKARSSSLARDQLLPFPREVRNATRRHIVLNALILLPILGCGEAQESAVKSAKRSWVSGPGDAAKSEAPASPNASGRAYESSAMVGGMAGVMGTAIQAPVNTAALSRNIIYDDEIDLIVKDVDPIAKQVVTFIQDARGYIAEQSTTGSPGSQRLVRWKRIALTADERVPGSGSSSSFSSAGRAIRAWGPASPRHASTSGCTAGSVRESSSTKASIARLRVSSLAWSRTFIASDRSPSSAAGT